MFSVLLVPLDGSRASLAVLPLVCDLAASIHAPVHLVRAVQDPLAASLPAYDGAAVAAAAVPAESREEAVLAAADDLRQDAQRLGEGLDVHVHAAIGAPAEVILDAIGKTGADVVAMSTHGRTALGALVMGSVAAEVVRQSPVPVLLMAPQRVVPEAVGQAPSPPGERGAAAADGSHD